MVFSASLAVSCASKSNQISQNTEGNAPPVIQSVGAEPNSIEIGGTVTATCAASDKENDPITYLWSATSGTFEKSVGSPVNWTAPTTAGTYTLSCMASDGRNQSQGSVDIKVTPKGGANHPPNILSGPTCSKVSVKANETIECTVTADDPDGDPLSYSWSATGGSFGTPTLPDSTWVSPGVEGSYTITVTVSDGRGGETPGDTVAQVKGAVVTTVFDEDFSVVPGWSYDPIASVPSAGFTSDGNFLMVGAWGAGANQTGPVMFLPLEPGLNMTTDTIDLEFYPAAPGIDNCGFYWQFMDEDGQPILSAGVASGGYGSSWPFSFGGCPGYYGNFCFVVANNDGSQSHAIADPTLAGKVTLSAVAGMFTLDYNGTAQASIAVTSAVVATKLRLGAARHSSTWCKTPEVMKLDWARMTKTTE